MTARIAQRETIRQYVMPNVLQNHNNDNKTHKHLNLIKLISLTTNLKKYKRLKSMLKDNKVISKIYTKKPDTTQDLFSLFQQQQQQKLEGKRYDVRGIYRFLKI